MEESMPATAKLFKNGQSQAVRLPKEYRFDGETVFIRRDKKTGDVILSSRPEKWDQLFALIENLDVPQDFLCDRDQPMIDRDPLDEINTK